MTVVADTSPLNYLIMIDEVDLLPRLFEHVLLPSAVHQELCHPKTSARIRQWSSELPSWAEIRPVAFVANPVLMSLDTGEREAIQLALDLGLSTVLLDDADARRTAEACHLQVRGTLGMLERGARLGITDFRLALDKLEQTNFRLSPAVRAAFLERNP
jgi:predicted nucleic acid-binding protein